DDAQKLIDAFGAHRLEESGRALYDHPIDLRVRMLAPSYSQYQRAAQRWWSGVEPVYVKKAQPRRPPVYFVSSNTHAIANLIGGYARAHSNDIVDWVKRDNPEDLAEELARVERANDPSALSPLLYYLLRLYIHADRRGSRMKEVRAFEAKNGLVHLSEPGHF